MSALDPITWAIILLVLGIALAMLEIFIPSGGLLSILAGTAVISSIVMAFRRDATTGLSFVLVALVAIPVAIGFALKIWPQTPFGKAFLGELPTDHDTKLDDPRRALVGRVGVARSPMLPSGAVLVDGKYLDAVAQGVAIEAGQPIVIVEVRANRVVVRAADPTEAALLERDPQDLLATPLEEFGLEGEDPLA